MNTRSRSQQQIHWTLETKNQFQVMSIRDKDKSYSFSGAHLDPIGGHGEVVNIPRRPALSTRGIGLFELPIGEINHVVCECLVDRDHNPANSDQSPDPVSKTQCPTNNR